MNDSSDPRNQASEKLDGEKLRLSVRQQMSGPDALSYETILEDLAARATDGDVAAARVLRGLVPELPDTDADRAAAIEALYPVLLRLQTTGRHEDAFEIASAWQRALTEIAPDDQLAACEVGLATAWALHETGDTLATEPALRNLLARCNGLVARYQAEAEQHPGGEADTALERARRAAGTVYNNFGVFEMAVISDISLAVHYFNQALIQRSIYRRDIYLKAQTLTNLSEAEQRRENYTAAHELIREAIEIVDLISAKQQIPEHPRLYAQLASVESDLGDEDACEKNLRAALGLAQTQASGESELVADLLVELAEKLIMWGAPLEAEIHLRHAVSIYRLTAGDETYKKTLNARAALSLSLWINGDILNAMSELSAAGWLLMARSRTFALEMGIEDRHMAGMNSTRLELDIFMSMAWDRPDVSSFAENAFDFLLQNKGLATEVFATRRARLRSHPSDKIRELLAELDALREQLSRMLLKPHEPEAERDLVGEIYEREVSIGALQRVAEHQEVEATVLAGADVQGIPRVQSQRSRYAQWIKSANNLRDVLPTDTTLIEFVRFQKINPKAWLKEKVTPFYLAFVLSGGETPPRVVRIGTAESVDELVKDLRVSLESDAAEFERGNEVTFEGSRTEKLAARLRAQVLDPVLATAGAANRLLLAPDGSLSMVPFGALPTADGYVLDAYEISYLTSGQDLLRPPAPPDARQEPPVVMADPDYDAGLDGEVVAAEGFTRLAGTRQEGEEVAALLGVSAALGAEATELRLKTVRSPAVLHIATHGWFLPRSDDGSRPAWAEHPRLARLAEDSAIHTLVVRSGLVLAGFNTAWAGADLPESMGDGVFTISDASALELAGTELVALSACDTALGGLISLEGVHGLRRAFLMAGARSSLTTLWKVSDHPTRQLMVDFYRRLRAGIPRATALRDAQLAMRVQTPHPHFWGAFVLHGDHGPLSAGLLNELPDPSPEAERETQLLLALGAIRRGDGTAAEGYLRQSAEDGDLHSAELLANLAEARGDEPEAERWWRKAALAGRPRAAAELGKLLARRNEMQEAERWWKIAIETGSEDEDIVYNLGFINLERGDRDEALRIWRVGAVRNNPRMLRALGIEAANVGDSAEATMWWTRAAEHGEPRAAHTLALAAQKRGDQVELSHWWRRAAELGYPAAAGQLGMAAYENGDYDEACSLWRAAAERGDLDIAYNLGVLLNRLDDPEAEKWWRRAAAAGRPESAYSLARLKKAKGDLRTAAHYWRIAADKGDDRSTVELARLLLAQGGIEEAESRIRPVAERGNADAANLLAQLLVQQEKYAESLQWTETAAAAGQPQAAHQMALIAADGGDRHREMDWWFKAAHAGEAAAVAKVSEMLAAANRPEAEQWLEKAAELGDGGAAVALCQLRFARGDEDGARRALVPAAEQEAEEARMALTLLDADEERIRRLAGRQFASSMRDLSVLAALRGEQETSDHWLMAAADQTNDANTLTEAGEAAMRADDHENAERWLRVAAGQGQPRAAYLLAELSQQQHDQGETAKWLTLAERLSVAEELSRTGQAAFDIGDDDAGTGNWLAAAHRGAADTGARLAHAMFEYGRSRPGDWTNEEAVNLARSAAAAGSAAGACTMGAILTERGNYQEGLTWFDRALRLAHGERPVDDQINTSQLNWSSEE